MKLLFLTITLVVCVTGLPRRYRRGTDQVTYGACKDTYDQCGEWKNEGMCAMNEYKDYMPTVCPVTCGFCKDGPVSPSSSEAAAAGSTEVIPSKIDEASPSGQTDSYTKLENDNTMSDYEATLKQYYADVQKQQADYLLQHPQTTDSQTTSFSQIINPDGSGTTVADTGTADPAASAFQPATQTSPAVAQQEQAPVQAPIAQVPVQAAVEPAQTTTTATGTETATGSQNPVNAKTLAPAQQTAAAVSLQAPEPDATQSSAPSGYTAPVRKPAGPSIGASEQSADSKLADPTKTSSALYKNNTKPSQDPASNSNEQETEDDSTNEKIATESKHLEKTLAKAKQARINAKGSKPSNDTKNEVSDDEDDEEAEMKQQKHFTNTTKLDEEPSKTFTKEVNKDKTKLVKTYSLPAAEKTHLSAEEKVHKKIKSSLHVEKSISALKSKRKAKPGQQSTRSDQPVADNVLRAFETEASLLEETDGAEESGSGSGSGSQGGLDDALDELNLIDGLNFDDADYDVADDLSNELANLDSKKFLKNNKEDAITSHVGKNTARSEISEEGSRIVKDENDVGDEDQEESGDAESGATEDDKSHTLLEITHKNGDLGAYAVSRKQIKPEVITSKKSHTGSGDAPSKKSHPGSGDSPSKKSHTSSGDAPSKKSHTGSGDAQSRKSQTGSGDSSSKKSHTGSGDAPSKKSHTGSGDAPSKKSHTGSGDAPSRKSQTGSGDSPSKKSHTGSGDAPSKKSNVGSGEAASKKSTTASGSEPSLKNEVPVANDESVADAESDAEAESGSGSQTDEAEGEEEEEDEEEEKPKEKKKVAADFLPQDLLPASEEERKENEEKEFGSGEPSGKISVVLKQNFNDQLKDSKSANYQMLAGNIKKDVEKALKSSKMKDISFSEATIEGNPRQTGKTKVSFNLKSKNPQVYTDLIKLVDEGSINGLSVVKASAESDDDDQN